MKKLDVVYFDAGGGHRAAATALKLIVEQEQRPWDVRLLHLRDVLDSVDVFRKVTGIDLQEIYNLMLRKGWTLGSAQGLRFMQSIIRLYHGQQKKLMAEQWRRDPPDMVVSVIPNFNRALFDGLAEARPGCPMVTLLTDLADCPPHFWIEQQKQWFICGTPKAADQARQLGHSADRIFETSGMILHPRFYQPMEIDRAAERLRLGLDPEKPTALVLFGGYGSDDMVGIARKLDASGLDLQLILICGRNEKLRSTLRSQTTRIKTHIEGFTNEVPYFMRLADFFIGKPGPGSISEAIHLGLPVITVRNMATLPQERFNSQWLTDNSLGAVVSSFRDIAGATARLLADGRLAAFRANALKRKNQALFEIPPILDTILRTTE